MALAAGSISSSTTTTTTTSRKRPRVLAGTTQHTKDVSSPLRLSRFPSSSTGSDYLSHGEDEHSTHYECDSEGTSATTNSELSHASSRAAAHKKMPSHMWGSGSSSGG
eukprot:scaffold708385_cov35-Attheya_sp.AAC.1